MEADLQELITAGKLDAKTAASLGQLKPGTFCLHKSWGFGQIVRWELLLNQIVIDFQSKKHHAMQLQYAAETVQPLPDHHIFVRKIKEQQLLKDLAQNDSAKLIQILLESFDGKSTQDQIQKVISPEIVPTAEFRKWWDNAKKSLEKKWTFFSAGQKERPDHDAGQIHFSSR